MQTEKAGSNPAYLDQPQALELEPINIMNDVSTNVNPAQVAISDIIFPKLSIRFDANKGSGF